MWGIRVYLLIFQFLIPGIPEEDKNDIYSKFFQHDYKLKIEWGQLISYNPRHVKECRVVAFKYNRTCTAANFTITYNTEIGKDLELVGQAYKFVSNEYRLFPVRLQNNFCLAIAHNIIGSRRIFDCGNCNGCYLKKGVRHEICNFVPDESKFPPLIPSGRYKWEVEGLYHDQSLFVVEAYAEVYRPIVSK